AAVPVLTVEQQPVADLTFICEGRTEVRVKDQVVAHVGAGAFIGDVSFTTGVPATATVTVDGPSRLLSFDQEKLHALCRRDEQIASALYRRIGGGLAEKMRVTTGKLWGARRGPLGSVSDNHSLTEKAHASSHEPPIRARCRHPPPPRRTIRLTEPRRLCRRNQPSRRGRACRGPRFGPARRSRRVACLRL